MAKAKPETLPVAVIVDEQPADVDTIDQSLTPETDDTPSAPDESAGAAQPESSPVGIPVGGETPEAAATEEKRRPGRPAGRVTGASYRGIKSKQAMRDLLKERDREIAELREKVERQVQTTAALSAAVQTPIDESFATMLDFVFDAIAAHKNAPHWKLPAATRDRIARPLAVAVAPHMGAVAEHMPIVVALSGLGSHVLYAVQQDKKLHVRDVAAPA